jgi:hypothetical protein
MVGSPAPRRNSPASTWRTNECGDRVRLTCLTTERSDGDARLSYPTGRRIAKTPRRVAALSPRPGLGLLQLDVVADHLLEDLGKRHLGLPSEDASRS